MRSSKSRSRSKSNRPRSPLGNIVNRVFDSSGPEGKVRGTPQQIIDKYLALARDAQLANDRVAAENFLQHAEHYARMLGEAQREIEAQRREYGGGPVAAANGHGGEPPRDDRRDDRRDERGPERRDDRRDERGAERRDDRRPPAPAAVAVIDFADDGGPELVETPEMRAEPAEGPAPVAPAEGPAPVAPAEGPAPVAPAAAPAPAAAETAAPEADVGQAGSAPAPRAPVRSRRRHPPRTARAEPSEAAE
jgi:hypothetical protein